MSVRSERFIKMAGRIVELRRELVALETQFDQQFAPVPKGTKPNGKSKKWDYPFPKGIFRGHATTTMKAYKALLEVDKPVSTHELNMAMGGNEKHLHGILQRLVTRKLAKRDKKKGTWIAIPPKKQ